MTAQSKREKSVGVYVCHCGSNIASTVDVEAVTEFTRSLPDVVTAENYIFMCSDQGQDLLKKDIEKHKLDRVIIAACSPRLHERTFRLACEEAGLNPYLMVMANIREHCSWVHKDRDRATEKAKSLIKGAVLRVVHHEALSKVEVKVNPATLIVGGGIAGIQAALDIAGSGHKVYLVEKEPAIGGHMIQLDKTFPTLDCSSCILTPKMSAVGSHPQIELMTYSEVEDISGYVGNFKVKIRKRARCVDEDKCNGCGLCQEKCPWKTESEFDLGLSKRKAIYTPFPQAVPNIPVIDKEHCAYFKEGTCRVCEKVCEPVAIDFEQQDTNLEVEVGSVIVATGFDEFDSTLKPEYGYGRYPNVISGLELERLLSAAGPTLGEIEIDGRVPKKVTFVQCVGSRDKTVGNEYCSRVCCMYTAKHAHAVKEKIPEAEVTVLYMDIRAFGKGYEQFYERVQREGVLYRRGTVAEVYRRGPGLIVRGEDTLDGTVFEEETDLVVLATGLTPRKDAKSIMRKFHVSPDMDGFFMEKHIKLDPIATSTEGVFIVGCCQGPKDIPDTVAQASAAAAKVLAMISAGTYEVDAAVAHIAEDLCSGCRLCHSLCVFEAISYDDEKKKSLVEEVLCKGCGICVSACPSGAITGRHFTDDQLMAEIEGILSE